MLERLSLLREPHFVCFIPMARDKGNLSFSPHRRARRAGNVQHDSFHEHLDDPDLPSLRFELIRLTPNLPQSTLASSPVYDSVHTQRRYVCPRQGRGQTSAKASRPLTSPTR